MKQNYYAQLAKTLAQQTTLKEMQNLLEGLLTPTEAREFFHRLEIVRLLRQGMTQRQIAQELGVGLATITRGSRELQRGKFPNVG